MSSLSDIRIFLGLVPKESPCIYRPVRSHKFENIKYFFQADEFEKARKSVTLL